MLRTSLKQGLGKARLRWLLSAFFLALALPTVVLVYQAQSRLKWEAFYQHQLMAEELTGRIDRRVVGLIGAEESRSFADYGFLVVAGDPSANFLQRSPLSTYPVHSDIPGLLSFFQVDAEGELSTPLLPPEGVEPGAYGIGEDEYRRRLGLEQRVRAVLSSNRLVRGRPSVELPIPVTAAPAEDESRRQLEVSQIQAERMVAPERPGKKAAAASEEEVADGDDVEGQEAFDQLKDSPRPRLVSANRPAEQPAAYSLGRVEDLKLDSSLASKQRSLQKSAHQPESVEELKRVKRKERSAIAEPQTEARSAARTERDAPGKYSGAGATIPADDVPGRADLRISTFESEIDPFEFSVLDAAHFVMYRTTWRDGRRYVQGAIIDRGPFIRGVVENAFRETSLARMSNLVVAYQGNVISAFGGSARTAYPGGGDELTGELLYQTRLSAPLSELELIFSITQLPIGPGGTLINWITIILVIVLCGGLYAMYRLGLGQINLARQQRDFVSAVSHELKTPLTSIRMYGEMLREGWADEGKKQTYYDYIHDESERLSRLIGNVLQLARMTRNDPQFDRRPVAVGELMDLTLSKIDTQVRRAGFELSIVRTPDAERAIVNVDSDCFAQIVINLVDNAIKFSAAAERREIVIESRLDTEGRVHFSVRDFGPGVPREQMRKIFELFYRPESEITRETVGTGIGLALVRQLAMAMDGKVDVRNCDPGAEFTVTFAAPARPT